MLNTHFSPGKDPSSEAGDPRQFGLIDLFAIVTLAALLSAMATPYLRTMPAENLGRLLVVSSIQLIITAGTIAFAANRRKQLLDKSGQRIGVAYCTELRWRHWPIVKSSILMLFFACAQLCFALTFATESIGKAVSVYVVYQLQLGGFTGFALARCMWRVYPGSIEFFDNGVALRGTVFFPWSRVDVRPSQLFTGRIVVVLRQAVGSPGGETKVAHVTDSQREQVFAAASKNARGDA